MQVQNFNPVDHDRFKEVSLKSLFYTPYGLGLENLQHVCDKESSFCGRVFRVITGLLLLIPLLNTITYIVLRQWSEKDPVEKFKEDVAQIIAKSDADIVLIEKEKRKLESEQMLKDFLKWQPIENLPAKIPLHQDVLFKIKTTKIRLAQESTSLKDCKTALLGLCKYLQENSSLIPNNTLKPSYLDFLKALEIYLDSFVGKQNTKTNNQNLDSLLNKHDIFSNLLKNYYKSDNFDLMQGNISSALILLETPFEKLKCEQQAFLIQITTWLNFIYLIVAVTQQ